MNPLGQLKSRFPYLFEGKNIGLEIPRGWLPLFAKLCQDIDTLLGANKRGFHWIQLKEKFGSARFYWGMNAVKPAIRLDLISPVGVVSHATQAKARKADQQMLIDRLHELVHAAEEETTHSCIVCGAPAANDRGDGWYLVLCPEHVRMRKAKCLPAMWFEGDENA